MNRRNYCRAMLIVYGVILVIYILFFLIFGLASEERRLTIIKSRKAKSMDTSNVRHAFFND